MRFHRTGTKRLHHPVVGELELSYETLTLDADDGLRMALYTAEPGSASQQALDLLASWTATPDPTESACAARPASASAPRRRGDTRQPDTRGPQDDDPCDDPCPDAQQRRRRCPPSASASSRARPRRPPRAVEAALRDGYRLIDTAAAYGNEREVGEAVRASGLDRSEVFLETKIWISDYGYDETLHGFEKSAGKLGVEQIDLLILHQALPSALRPDARGLPRAGDAAGRRQGPRDRRQQLHGRPPHRAARPRRRSCRRSTRSRCTPTSSSRRSRPSAPSTASSRRRGRRSAASPSTATASTPAPSRTRSSATIAEAHGKTPAQVMLRWGLQHGRSVIPKSTKPERIAENIDVFDFELTADEMAAIDGLDTGRRGGPEPEAITLEAFGRDIPEA